LCNNANGNQHILLTVIPIEVQLILLLIVVPVDIIFRTLSVSSGVSAQRCITLKKMAVSKPLAIDKSDQGQRRASLTS
jgi:hypothetical protein